MMTFKIPVMKKMKPSSSRNTPPNLSLIVLRS